MAEESKQPFDPDATVKQSTVEIDADVTPTGPVQTVDPEATFKGPVFDPEATVNPAQRAALEDPEATVRIPSPGKRVKQNPFAPHALPETLQANLAALGGLNALIAIANPILGAVPQIRRALKHPDPARLRQSLRDQIEAFEISASSADIPDQTVAAAVYALCALLDESAASTPWGRDWTESGLLNALRSEKSGAEGFFALLDKICADPDGNADLIEFFYICLALGFEGRYRDAEGGKRELGRVRDRVYALISRRRPRPRDGLSARWRSELGPQSAAQAAPELSPKIAEGVSAKVSLVRGMPLRSKLSLAAAIVVTLLAGYLLSLRLIEDQPKTEPMAQKPHEAAAPAPAAPAPPPATNLAREIGEDAVSVAEKAGRNRIELRHDRQFASGSARPAAELRPLIGKIAQALDRVLGAIVVTGHADATPPRSGSNQDLSVARARSVARMISAALGDPKRVQIEGKADSDPLAPNDSEANRAKNRRVVIELRP